MRNLLPQGDFQAFASAALMPARALSTACARATCYQFTGDATASQNTPAGGRVTALLSHVKCYLMFRDDFIMRRSPRHISDGAYYDY